MLYLQMTYKTSKHQAKKETKTVYPMLEQQKKFRLIKSFKVKLNHKEASFHLSNPFCNKKIILKCMVKLNKSLMIWDWNIKSK